LIDHLLDESDEELKEEHSAIDQESRRGLKQFLLKIIRNGRIVPFEI
jgi:hypothetical protein